MASTLSLYILPSCGKAPYMLPSHGYDEYMPAELDSLRTCMSPACRAERDILLDVPYAKLDVVKLDLESFRCGHQAPGPQSMPDTCV